MQTYLKENAIGYWWTMSPDSFSGGGARVWGVGGSFMGGNVSGPGGVRPSISLKSTTNVTGNGTSSTPYKVVS